MGTDMHSVYSHKVRANVRPDGAIRDFCSKEFDLMLSADYTPERRVKEAIRILRQMGLETRGVKVEERA